MTDPYKLANEYGETLSNSSHRYAAHNGFLAGYAKCYELIKEHIRSQPSLDGHTAQTLLELFEFTQPK